MNKQAAVDLIKTYRNLGQNNEQIEHFFNEQINQCNELLIEEKQRIWIDRLSGAVATYQYGLSLLKKDDVV